jgi:hypothetical protein
MFRESFTIESSVDESFSNESFTLGSSVDESFSNKSFADESFTAFKPSTYSQKNEVIQSEFHQLSSLSPLASTLLSSPLNPPSKKLNQKSIPRFISTAIPPTTPLQLLEHKEIIDTSSTSPHRKKPSSK